MIVGVDEARNRRSPLQVDLSGLWSRQGADVLVGAYGQKLSVSTRKGLGAAKGVVSGQNMNVVNSDIRIG